MFSTNSHNPKGFAAGYLYDITKYYKIWFSKQPDVFLGIENELRFIRMRQENPDATLFFIYSSICLTERALKRLKEFCIRHKITPVDFDNDIPKLLNNDLDKELYHLAKTEIQRTLSKENGNLAAASDCTRIIAVVIENFGIYSDFDIVCKVSTLSATHVQLKAPVLLNAEMNLYDNADVILSPNSDFLAFSQQDEKSSQLSTEALLAIQQIQKTIIKNYKEPITSKTFSHAFLEIPQEYSLIFNNFLKQFPKNPSIFDFRKYISSLSVEKNALGNMITLLNASAVINISGPYVYSYMYKQLFPKGVEILPARISGKNSVWNSFLDMYRKSSVGFYDPIADRIVSKNAVTNAYLEISSPKNSIFCDQSWTPKGELSKKQREKEIVTAGMTVLSFWRKKHPETFIITHYNSPPDYDPGQFKMKKK